MRIGEHKISDRLQAKLNERKAKIQPKEHPSIILAKEIVKSDIERAFPFISKQLRSVLVEDEFGFLIFDGRDMVFKRYLHSLQNRSGFPKFETKYAAEFSVTLVEFIRDQWERIHTEIAEKGFNLTNLPTDGLEFEYWVAEALNLFGWQTKVSKGSGDQGVDVIAVKNDVVWAIQCKLYSQPVGNKAVQEVYAGSQHYKADIAAVITNAGYTASAKELAKSTNVRLLSPEDIPTMGK